jgi:hypothetical protein
VKPTSTTQYSIKRGLSQRNGLDEIGRVTRFQKRWSCRTPYCQKLTFASSLLFCAAIGLALTATPMAADLPNIAIGDSAGRGILEHPRASLVGGEVGETLLAGGSATSNSGDLVSPTYKGCAFRPLPCPSSGVGAIVAPARCLVFTPADLGADPSGVNATERHYALEPAGTPRNRLVLMLNGSGGTPATLIAAPKLNVYQTLAADGYHVLALAYRSDNTIRAACDDSATCFGPTRESIVLGINSPGSAFSDVSCDEGIVERLDAALGALATTEGGWAAFRRAGNTPLERVAWDLVIAAGFSQGGGHAAYLGKLVQLAGVLQLSSTCDAVGGVPASWTSDGSWLTPPAERFIGFGHPDDELCRNQAAVWGAMGLAPARQHLDATSCSGPRAHPSTVRCAENIQRIPSLLSP